MRSVVIVLLDFGAQANFKELSSKYTTHAQHKFVNPVQRPWRLVSMEGMAESRQPGSPLRVRSVSREQNELYLGQDDLNGLSEMPMGGNLDMNLWLPEEIRGQVTYEYLMSKPWDQRLAWEEAFWWQENAIEWQQFAAVFVEIARQAGARWKEAVPEWTQETMEMIQQRSDMARSMAKRAKETKVVGVEEVWTAAAVAWESTELKKPQDTGEWSEEAALAIADACSITAAAVRVVADKAGGANQKTENVWQWASAGGVGWAAATTDWDHTEAALRIVAALVSSPDMKKKPDLRDVNGEPLLLAQTSKSISAQTVSYIISTFAAFSTILLTSLGIIFFVVRLRHGVFLTDSASRLAEGKEQVGATRFL